MHDLYRILPSLDDFSIIIIEKYISGKVHPAESIVALIDRDSIVLFDFNLVSIVVYLIYTQFYPLTQYFSKFFEPRHTLTVENFSRHTIQVYMLKIIFN